MFEKKDGWAILRLARGQMKRIKEDDSEGDSHFEVSYHGYIPRANAHVISYVAYEAGGTVLINHDTGVEQAVGTESFAISDDGRWVTSLGCEIEGASSCVIQVEKLFREETLAPAWSCELPYVELAPLAWSGKRAVAVEYQYGARYTGPSMPTNKTYRIWMDRNGDWRSTLPCKKADE